MMDKELKKRVQAETFVFLATLGIFALFNAIWQSLELHFYGEIQQRIVDSIMGVFIFWSFHSNVDNWLIRWFGDGK